MTTTRTELGISPVLFQAIAQLTASTSATPTKDSVISQAEKSSSFFKGRHSLSSKDMERAQSSKDTNQIVSQLLQRLHEPVVSIIPNARPQSQSGIFSAQSEPVIIEPNQSALTKAGLSMLGISSEHDTNQNSSVVSLTAQQLPPQQQQMQSNSITPGQELTNFLLKQEPVEEELSSSSAMSSVQTINNDVSSVLSALANQHVQESLHQQKDGNRFKNITPLHNVNSTSPAIVANILNASEQPKNQQSQIIIYGLQYNNNNTLTQTVSSASSSQVNEKNMLEEAEVVRNGQAAYRVLVQSPDGHSVEGKTVVLPSDTDFDFQQLSGGQSIQPISDVQNAAEGMNQPCPVCGDKVSGYHYGIFTCESCKGFFKRTVQNKKTFVCPKSSNCAVNIVNRKKCPACRFKRCIVMGMKIEAIRQDRTRGGRSSYDGCTPQKVKAPAASALKKAKKDLQAMEGVLPGPSPEVDEGNKSHKNLVAILNHSIHKQTTPNSGTPTIPELLRDIMNLEPLLSDDDIPPDSLVDNAFPDSALYSYMMQLAELRLYKLVRWARNLPQFGAISTDDQILLLQNCWSELIALALCWRSIDTPNQISISSTHHITTEWAQHLGCEDLVSRLLKITNSFRSLYMDNYEYVALKVLLLISPDVKGLKEPKKIRDFQDKLMEALMIYTMSHYESLKNKFGELLLRLPELSRLSFLSKNILVKYLPTNSATCGLLVELLKGDSRLEQDNTSGPSGMVL